ncbi:hypothetical protein BH23PLA1_BH23PLA1_04380 [soil metagenome]
MASTPDLAERQAAAPARSLEDLAPGTGPPERWYDRSSIQADAMVTIADQSPEDFERLAPEGRFCEYIDGVIYMPSPATDRHQLIVFFLASLFDFFRWERGGPAFADLLLGPAVLRLSETCKLEPDIFIRPAAGAEGDQPPALLVVEVLSRSTKSHDLGRKLQVYRDAGIPEIWLIDDLSEDRAIYVERKVGEGYRRDMVRQGRVESTILPGFWINAEWLWAQSLPNPRECLLQMLGP